MTTIEGPRQPSFELVLQQAIGPEFQYYLDIMRQIPADRFAVIKVGGAIVQEELDNLADSLLTLSRLGLYPIVVHGAGPQINRSLEEKGITPKFYDGIRVTDKDTLTVVGQKLGEVNQAIVDIMGHHGVMAEGITQGVFGACLQDEHHLGQVGSVVSVNSAPIVASIEKGCIPVVSCLGTDERDNPLNINGDVAAAALAAERQPYRYVSLTKTGGIFNSKRNIIPVLNSAGKDIEELIEKGIIGEGMLPKVREAVDLLDVLGEKSSVVITSPENLIRELFTHAGAGTLIRNGTPIAYHQSPKAANQGEVKRLIEDSLGGQLDSDYFDNLGEAAEIFITDRHYGGVAIVKPGVNTEPAYLDKLVVTPQAQGRGVGEQLLRSVMAEHPEGVYWRARPDNPQIGWYSRFASQTQLRGDWVVFMYGVGDNMRNWCADKAISHPATVSYQ